MNNNLICPHCLKLTSSKQDFCPHCTKVLPLCKEDYFSLLSLPASYEIDIKTLDNKLFQLQQLFHPDKFLNTSEEEQNISLNNSAIVNQAYKTLKNPILRAEYLLKLKSMNIEKEEVPKQLLIESLEWRENLEFAEEENKLQQILQEIIQKEQNSYKLLKEYFAKELYNQALSVYIELKFYLRFKQEITNKLDLINETI